MCKHKIETIMWYLSYLAFSKCIQDSRGGGGDPYIKNEGACQKF